MHPRSTGLQIGARWILKRGGVIAGEDKIQKSYEKRRKLLAR